MRRKAVSALLSVVLALSNIELVRPLRAVFVLHGTLVPLCGELCSTFVASFSFSSISCVGRMSCVAIARLFNNHTCCIRLTGKLAYTYVHGRTQTDVLASTQTSKLRYVYAVAAIALKAARATTITRLSCRVCEPKQENYVNYK